MYICFINVWISDLFSILVIHPGTRPLAAEIALRSLSLYLAWIQFGRAEVRREEKAAHCQIIGSKFVICKV